MLTKALPTGWWDNWRDSMPFQYIYVVQCSSHSSASPLTASTSAFHVLSARRRRIFTPRKFRDLQWTLNARRIWQNPSTDRQRSLQYTEVLMQRRSSTSHDEISIIIWQANTKRISRRTLKLLIPDDFCDNCVLFAAKIASLRRR